MRIPGPIAGRRCRAAVVAAVVACSTAFTGPGPTTADGGPTPSVPAPELDWRPCVQGGPFDCATTEEPLGYRDPGGRTIELAVVRRKATGPGGRVGTLFFNPGGPGGPGTVQMPQNCEFFPQEVRERFDIVSWGPRGVGNSTAVNCFASPEEAAAWNAGRPAGFPVGGKERAAYTAAYKDLVRPRPRAAASRVDRGHGPRPRPAPPGGGRPPGSPTWGSPTARSWAPPTPTSSPTRSARWSSTATGTRRHGRTTVPTRSPGPRPYCGWVRTARRRRPRPVVVPPPPRPRRRTARPGVTRVPGLPARSPSPASGGP